MPGTEKFSILNDPLPFEEFALYADPDKEMVEFKNPLRSPGIFRTLKICLTGISFVCVLKLKSNSEFKLNVPNPFISPPIILVFRDTTLTTSRVFSRSSKLFSLKISPEINLFTLISVTLFCFQM